MAQINRSTKQANSPTPFSRESPLTGKVHTSQRTSRSGKSTKGIYNLLAVLARFSWNMVGDQTVGTSAEVLEVLSTSSVSAAWSSFCLALL